MKAQDFNDAAAVRLDFNQLRATYPDNRLLHVMAQANLRHRAEYRCLIDGAPVIVTRDAGRKEGGQ